MDMFREYLSSKMEHITTSSLYSHILFWGGKLHFKSNNQKQQHHRNGSYYYYYYYDYRYYYGLQTLVHSEEKKTVGRNLHWYHMGRTETSEAYSTLRSSLWSSSPSPVLKSTVMGDLIGTESGDCMSCDVEVGKGRSDQSESSDSRRKIRGGIRRTERVFPPAITLIRETGRMPWSFKREYSEDGRRLIIMAERVRRHEYVEADRENGRLTMKLVHVDDDDYCEECGWPIDEVEEIEEKSESDFEFKFEEEEEDDSELLQNESSSGRCGSLRHCVSYAGSSSDGGLFRDSDNNSLWIGNANNDNTYLGRPGSAPLQPMTPVM